jgi:hypothetical protein
LGRHARIDAVHELLAADLDPQDTTGMLIPQLLSFPPCRAVIPRLRKASPTPMR